MSSNEPVKHFIYHFISILHGLCVFVFKEKVRRSLYDRNYHCPYFSPEVILQSTRRANREFKKYDELKQKKKNSPQERYEVSGVSLNKRQQRLRQRHESTI